MSQFIKIGLLGFGNVGKTVYELLQKNASLLKLRLSKDIQIQKIAVKNLKKKRDVDASLLTDDYLSVVNDPDVDIVVELMGDYPEALEAIETALQNGKPVVTANKAMIAKHGPKLFDLASGKNVKILFEAAVAGGIPVLRLLREGLSANQILSLRGIINGTANYILSSMSVDKKPFAEVLKQAQDLGYAEADPTSDIEGHDSASKLCILSMLCYGVWIPVEKIYTQGITQISQLDFEMAKKFQYTIKLMGITKQDESGIEARVHPVMIPKKNPIAHINGAFNAIQYFGDYAGEGMLYGHGAGGGPTASAVVSDIVEMIRHIDVESIDLTPTGFALGHLQKTDPISMDDLESAYYLRMTVIDKPNVLSQITGILGQHQISIQNLYQQGYQEERQEIPVIVFTHHAKEGNMQKALREIDQLESVVKPTYLIRIEEN